MREKWNKKNEKTRIEENELKIYQMNIYVNIIVCLFNVLRRELHEKKSWKKGPVFGGKEGTTDGLFLIYVK